MRVSALLLLFAAVVAAQTVEEMADQASRSITGPKQRLDLMQQLMKREGGAAALALVALDKARDPEVVHTAVEVLLDEGLAADHLERICALLLTDRHRSKVEERLYRYAQDHPAQTRLLVAQLGNLARDPKGEPEAATDRRLGAVRALGRIPLREAVEVLALVWSESKGPVAALCSIELADVLEASTGQEALDRLKERPFASYTDLVKEVSRKRADRVAQQATTISDLLGMAFRMATAEEVFQTLKKSDPVPKPYAAERAHGLAAAKQYGTKGAEYFASEIVDSLLAELRRDAIRTCVELVATLQVLYATSALGDAGLPRAAEVRDALRVGSSGGADEINFATLVIGLLRQMGPAAAPVLAEYARSHEAVDVRVSAVQALGDLASKGDKTLKAEVGTLLAGLLQINPPRAVLSQILFSLKAAPSDAAIESIQKLLFPEDPKLALARDDVISCVELLGATPSVAALVTLERLAREASDLTLRLDAVDRGLVVRTQGGDESARVLSFLEGLVLDPAQAEALRLGVLTALGTKGNGSAAPLLGTLASDANLDAKIRAAATAQRLALAARLVRGNGEVTEDVLAVVAVILTEEMARPNADVAAMVGTARTAVQVADRNKVRARGCRALFAELLGRQPETNPAELRAAWKDASDKAAGDGLTPAQQLSVTEAYRALLLAAKPAKEGDRALVLETIRTNLRLRDLAEKTGDAEASYRYWLDALDGAVVRLRDRGEAELVIGRRPTAGELAGDLATRWEKLQELLKALPTAG